MRILDQIKSLSNKAQLVSISGISLTYLTIIIGFYLRGKYNRAIWQEKIVKWKAEGVALEAKLVADICSGVATGLKASASNNA